MSYFTVTTDSNRSDVDGAADRRRWWALVVLCLSLVLITLDNTVLNVALPTLQRDLGATTSQLQWIVDGYQLVFAGLLFTTGSLADRYGRKGMLQLGLIVFGLGTTAAAFADSANMLIATRAFMGIGGAMIMPATLSILGTVFPEKAERAKAIAIWAAMAAIGIAIGPVIGGVLLAHFSWGSIFIVNVPVVIVALVGGYFLLPTSKDPAPGKMDPVGALLSIVTLVALVFAVIEGPDHGWTSGIVLGAATIGVLALAAFLWWESHSDHPMLDLALFRDRRFSVGALTLTLLYFGALGTYFLYTQHLQFVLGYSPLRAGVYSVPFALALIAFSLQTPRAVARFGTAKVAGAGLMVVALSTLIRAFATGETGYPLLVVSLIIAGVGVGMSIAPSTASIMSALPPEKAGVGSAINDAARQVGAATGVAVLGSIWASSFHGTVQQTATAGGLPPATVDASSTSMGHALEAAQHLPAAAQHTLVTLANDGFVHAADVANLVGTAVLVVGAVLALRYLRQPSTGAGRRASSVEVDLDADIVDADIVEVGVVEVGVVEVDLVGVDGVRAEGSSADGVMVGAPHER